MCFRAYDTVKVDRAVPMTLFATGGKELQLFAAKACALHRAAITLLALLAL